MDDLERRLQGARDVPVPDALMERVLQDALAMQPVARPVQQPFLKRLGAALGGWQSLVGLGLAGCAGFWIGVAPPAFLLDTALYMLGAAEADAGSDAFGWAAALGEDAL